MPSPTAVTLSSLIQSVRFRADIVNSQFVTDAELTGYINASYAELYDIIVQKYGDNYYVQVPFKFQTNGQDYLYPLPDDFYKMLGVDMSLTSSQDAFIDVPNFNFKERNKFSVPNIQRYYGALGLRYRVINNNPAQIWFIPIPTAVQQIQIWYVPMITYLVAPSDTVNGISGWEEYIVIDAAIKCMQKEESDVSVLMAQKEAMIKRIEAAAENRDAGTPEKVADALYSQFDDYGFGQGGWGNGSGYGG